MAVTLAEVLRRFGPEYLRSHNLTTAQAKAWRAIVSCRTPALGGQLFQCDECGQQQWRWLSRVAEFSPVMVVQISPPG